MMPETSDLVVRRLEAEEFAGDLRGTWQAITDLIADGRMPIAELMNRVPIDPALAELRALVAVEALPAQRKVDARRAFASEGISPHARLGELSAAQRTSLSVAFGSASAAS